MNENVSTKAECAPAGSARTGSFRFWIAEQRWEWSDEVAVLHGYAPGEVKPTTELLLQHKHPDDRAQVADILDTAGRTRHVLVVGDELLDSDGTILGTTG